jgi:hypothetical protein
VPRQRRKTKKKIPPPGLTDGVREVLEEGFAAVCYEIEHGHLPPNEEVREWWDLYGERVTLDYAEAHPGERPWGWWEWEAPDEERRILGIQYTPFETAGGMGRSCGEWERKTLFDPEIGLKARGAKDAKELDEIVGEKVQPSTWIEVLEEPQHEYLARHGLLTEDEMARLSRKATNE